MSDTSFSHECQLQTTKSWMKSNNYIIFKKYEEKAKKKKDTLYRNKKYKKGGTILNLLQMNRNE